nr:hypothetical protein [uncultured Allomuricauda sp.]
MNKEEKFLLLTLIGNDGSLDNFQKLGYDSSTITDLIEKEISVENATFEGESLKLTEKGKNSLNELAKSLDYSLVEKTISPLLSAKASFPKNQIYVPGEDEIDF